MRSLIRLPTIPTKITKLNMYLILLRNFICYDEPVCELSTFSKCVIDDGNINFLETNENSSL